MRHTAGSFIPGKGHEDKMFKHMATTKQLSYVAGFEQARSRYEFQVSAYGTGQGLGADGGENHPSSMTDKLVTPGLSITIVEGEARYSALKSRHKPLPKSESKRSVKRKRIDIDEAGMKGGVGHEGTDTYANSENEECESNGATSQDDGEHQDNKDDSGDSDDGYEGGQDMESAAQSLSHDYEAWVKNPKKLDQLVRCYLHSSVPRSDSEDHIRTCLQDAGKRILTLQNMYR